MRQGRVYFLLGNDEHAGDALGEVRHPPAPLRPRHAAPWARPRRSSGARSGPATGSYLEIPGKIAQQAEWEFEAGLCRLEGGLPGLAAEHFTKALTLSPKLTTRPIIAYYLEKARQARPPAPGR